MSGRPGRHPGPTARRTGLLLLVLVLAALGLGGCRGLPSAPGADAVAASRTVPAAESTPPTPSATSSAPAAGTTVGPGLTLPSAGSQVVVFGDSYTEGVGASSADDAYPARLAAQFGWVADVRGAGGTGFVARGGIDADYLDRLASFPLDAPPLMIVQGGLNDALAGVPELEEQRAARRVLQALRERYPMTQLVVVGPPQVQVVDEDDVQAVERALRQATQELGVPYVSPLGEQWDLAQFTDADGLHPDDDGHDHLAVRIAADLRQLSR